MRILGLDPGEKRIGVAVSDPLGITAQGLKVIKHTNLNADVEAIAGVCREYEVRLIVLGYPLNMNGTVGNKAKQAEELAGVLRERLGLEVVLWDERLSTRAVQGTLLQADTSRKRRKEVVDKLAAAYILQGYLDRIKKAPVNKDI